MSQLPSESRNPRLTDPTTGSIGKNARKDVDALPEAPEVVQIGALRPTAEEHDIAIAAYRALWHDSKPCALDLRVWCLLAREPDLGVGRIAAMFEVDRRTIGRAINRLVDAGLAQREDQNQDPLTGNFGVVSHVALPPKRSASESGITREALQELKRIERPCRAR